MVRAVVQATAIVIFHCVQWGKTIIVQKTLLELGQIKIIIHKVVGQASIK